MVRKGKSYDSAPHLDDDVHELFKVVDDAQFPLAA